jgi:hypothetical protein
MGIANKREALATLDLIIKKSQNEDWTVESVPEEFKNLKWFRAMNYVKNQKKTERDRNSDSYMDTNLENLHKEIKRRNKFKWWRWSRPGDPDVDACYGSNLTEQPCTNGIRLLDLNFLGNDDASKEATDILAYMEAYMKRDIDFPGFCLDANYRLSCYKANEMVHNAIHILLVDLGYENVRGTTYEEEEDEAGAGFSDVMIWLDAPLHPPTLHPPTSPIIAPQPSPPSLLHPQTSPIITPQSLPPSPPTLSLSPPPSPSRLPPPSPPPRRLGSPQPPLSPILPPRPPPSPPRKFELRF